MKADATPATAGPPKTREWSPRLWEGADYFAWVQLLVRNRFAVSPGLWYIALIISCVTFLNTVLRWLQDGFYGSRIRATPITHAPIFVIGHWRTGTTLLHELLILDNRHTFPDTFACFEPNHILLSEHFFKQRLAFLMPQKRPMDNMAAGWERPQEDEFALSLLGQPSSYTDIAFPNRPPLWPGSLDGSGLNLRQQATWKRTLMTFVRTLTFRDNRRLVLKSPPHTARIPQLLELFPDARFVCIVRNPYELFPSTVNLWHSLSLRHGLQTPKSPAIFEEKVFQEFRTLHERYAETKHLIPAGRLVEVRYEEVVHDLVGALEKIYDGLQLGEFETVRPKVEEYANKNKNYERNNFRMSDETRARITGRWGDLIAKLGYSGS